MGLASRKFLPKKRFGVGGDSKTLGLKGLHKVAPLVSFHFRHGFLKGIGFMKNVALPSPEKAFRTLAEVCGLLAELYQHGRKAPASPALVKRFKKVLENPWIREGFEEELAEDWQSLMEGDWPKKEETPPKEPTEPTSSEETNDLIWLGRILCGQVWHNLKMAEAVGYSHLEQATKARKHELRRRRLMLIQSPDCKYPMPKKVKEALALFK